MRTLLFISELIFPFPASCRRTPLPKPKALDYCMHIQQLRITHHEHRLRRRLAVLPHGGADAQTTRALVSEENRLLRDEVDRYRKHVTKLIDMHNDAALERDKLRIKLRDADSRISDLLRDACNSWATDLHVLLKAVYGGRAPISVLTVNWGALDDWSTFKELISKWTE